MDVVVDRCAGLDVHRDSVMATVRVPGIRRRQRERQTRGFGTTVAQLEALGDWLAGFGVTLVGMEATGIYWQPVFHVLEPRFECWLLNAQHLHNVPGRKSDVIDSAWICELVEHGLVRPSFVPPPEIRRLRELTRLRKAEIQERTRTIQRLEKLLQSVGIKLTSVASQAYSVSARAMLEALLTASATRTSWPSSPAVGCGRRSRCCARRSPTASSSPTTACWSASCSPTSTRSTRRSPPSTSASSWRQHPTRS
jgi:transposase